MDMCRTYDEGGDPIGDELVDDIIVEINSKLIYWVVS